MNHVFRFDQETKFDLLNISQYSLLATIPIVLLNKLMKNYIPEADETKGSIEILFEIIGQLIILFIGLFYVHRIVTFIPTYSGEDYQPITLLNIVLIALTILLSIQTKLGEKCNILVERFVNIWEGHTTMKETNANNKNTVRVTQPIVQPPNNTVTMNSIPPSSNYIDNTGYSTGAIPPGTAMQNPPLLNPGAPDFNAMYQQNPTPMVGAQQPMDMGVMAANEALGGSFSMF